MGQAACVEVFEALSGDRAAGEVEGLEGLDLAMLQSLVGDAGLAVLYREALTAAGCDSVIEAGDDLTIAGLATAVGAGEEERT